MYDIDSCTALKPSGKIISILWRLRIPTQIPLPVGRYVRREWFGVASRVFSPKFPHSYTLRSSRRGRSFCSRLGKSCLFLRILFDINTLRQGRRGYMRNRSDYQKWTSALRVGLSCLSHLWRDPLEPEHIFLLLCLLLICESW